MRSALWLIVIIVLTLSPAQAAGSTVRDFNAAYTASQAAVAKNDHVAAINHTEEAFRIHKELFGPQTRDGAALSLNLTRLYGATERWTNAVLAAEEGVRIVEAIGGANDSALVPLLYELGNAHVESDQFDGAVEALERALSIAKKDPSISAVLRGDINFVLGKIDLDREDARDLREHAQASKEAYEEAYGPESFQVATALFQLGMAAQMSRKYEKALRHYQAAMVILEATHSTDDQLYDSVRIGLARLANHIDKPELVQKYVDQLNASNTSRKQATPIVRVPPYYPSGAARKGTEGWVLLEFTITKSGNVKDIKVVDADPRGVFGESAMKAVKKWKYAAKKVDGVAVEQFAMQQLITYQLEN